MSLRLDAEARERLRAIRQEERALLQPVKQARKAEQKAARKARPKREQRIEHKPMTPPPADDGSGYMSWLHCDIPCIGCLVLGPHPLAAAPIEAAHQKLQCADRGWNRRAGRRGPHWTCVALCRGHHQIGPLCCDPAQAKFWRTLGLEVEQVIDFVEALNAAYREDRPGAPIVIEFANLARARRAA